MKPDLFSLSKKRTIYLDKVRSHFAQDPESTQEGIEHGQTCQRRN